MSPATVRWTDNHCHVGIHLGGGDGAGDADVTAILAEARDAGVERLINVGTDVQTSRAALAVAHGFDGVWATAGIHPHDAKDVVTKGGRTIDLSGIEELLDDPKNVAVGECGLDFHYDHSPRPVQQRVFAAQIALARRTGKTLVIHTREAWDETFAILDSAGVPERTVFHCFTGGADQARKGLDRGIRLSFSGIVSYKTADDLREAAKVCPLDMLLVETDSPYLTPVPHRGKQNKPAWVPLVGEAVAAAKGVPVREVAEASWDNATALYCLPEG
ncbi:MAG: TatD family hydrolase [Actinobacteria bacterium]|nr:TatD family hydrolase [Actinomycetota bacterium]